MGGRITTKPRGAHVPHEKKLAKLEKRLTVANTVEELSELAREFHMVNYSLGHDIAAIIAMPKLVDRASQGKLRSNERTADAYVLAGDVCRGIHALFRALETYPDAQEDRVRIATRMAEVLEPIDGALAAQLRSGVDGLPTDAAEARQEFANRIRVVQDAINWDALPRGTTAGACS